MIDRIRGFVGSGWFLALTVGLFLVSASWIALSGRFSMAYDENTHLGVIQLYSDRLLPFWSEAPAGSEVYGAVERDPSYLYHYVLSFPYRLVDAITQSQFAQVIILRFVNIGIFLAGILVFRRVLLRTGASKALVHAMLAALVLLPGVPFLAAQINYDNALFLASTASILLAMRITGRLKRSGRFGALQLSLFLGLILLSSLVKYAFLPIMLALVLWLAWAAWKYARPRNFLKPLWEDFQKLARLKRTFLVVFILVSACLFVERYGVNTVLYRTPTPECNQVIGIEACRSYGPWNRNYELLQQKQAGRPADSGRRDPLSFTAKHWLKSMAHQQVFALNGRGDYFKIGDPLPLPKFLVVVVGGIGLVLAAFWYRVLRHQYELDLLLVVALTYAGLLWLQNYLDFLHLGQAVALQGRYLMPVLPIVMLVVALAYLQTLRRFNWAKLMLAAGCLFILLFQGGGAATYIVRSDERWYWQNQTVIDANKTAQKILKIFVVGS